MRRVVIAAALLSSCMRAQTSAKERTVIALDPGHPSEVADGTDLRNGITEVHVAWVVALDLRKALESQGYKVVMTKNAEMQMVRNVERAKVGNDAHAALMVRLHLDASRDSGYAVYYPDRVGTAEGKTGPSEDIMRTSHVAADAMSAAMAPLLAGRLKDQGVKGDSKTLVGSRQGALTGSIFSEVPVVLIEMATPTNAHDAAFISSDSGRAIMVRAIAAGVARAVPLR
jgi:N-acetylmuramoyl-L-alanine amidase